MLVPAKSPTQLSRHLKLKSLSWDQRSGREQQEIHPPSYGHFFKQLIGSIGSFPDGGEVLLHEAKRWYGFHPTHDPPFWASLLVSLCIIFYFSVSKLSILYHFRVAFRHFASIFLFFGDSGKTSLLFQFAINCASDSFGNVVFICNKRRLENKPPFLSHGVDPSSEALQHIQIKYVEDDEGIKKFFAAFHLHESFPVAVIIDDFGDFFSDKNCQQRYNNARGRDLAMVRTLALGWDAIAHANKKLEPKASCNLLVADTHQGDSPRLLFIYKRWIQCIFTIQGDGSGSYILKNSCISGNRRESMRIAKYSIALQHLALEEIVEQQNQEIS